MIATLQCTVLDCPDPRALARFYGAVLGWRVVDEGERWCEVHAPDGSGRLAFQLAPDLRPPRWPDPDHPQQLHLDFDVADIEAAHREVIALGATFLRDSQGTKSGFRVYTDPAGHPFCLCYGQS